MFQEIRDGAARQWAVGHVERRERRQCWIAAVDAGAWPQERIQRVRRQVAAAGQQQRVQLRAGRVHDVQVLCRQWFIESAAYNANKAGAGLSSSM